VVAAHQWSWPRWVVVGGGTGMGLFMLVFLAANLTKLAHGAWVPLVIGTALFTVMTTWQRGRRGVTALRQRQEGPLHALLDDVAASDPPLALVPGTAVYLNRGSASSDATAPLAMRATVEHLRALHSRVVVVSVETAGVPQVPIEEVGRTAERRPLVDGARPAGELLLVELRFGYLQRTDVPDALAALSVRDGLEVDLDGASWFLSTLDLRRAGGDDDGDGAGAPGLDMPRWQRGLFTATSRLTTDAARAFDLPAARTVVMGARLEV